MFNDDFEFFDDVSEHANLPKVLTNSPNLFNKKTSIFNFNGNTTTFTKVEKKQNLNNRKILNKNIKLTLEIEESHINKSHNIIYSNKNKLLFSQKLPIHKELKNNIIKNSPKLEDHLRSTIENGEHVLYSKKVLQNGIVNSNPNKEHKNNNLDKLNKKIIIKKNVKHNRTAINNNFNNDNSLNVKINSPYKKILNNEKSINLTESNFKKPDLSRSRNIKFRTRKRTINQRLDLNKVKTVNNKPLNQKEPKQVIESYNKEINTKDPKKNPMLSINSHINPIKFFISNSSQVLFNKENNNENNFKKTIEDKNEGKKERIENDSKNEFEIDNILTINSIVLKENDKINNDADFNKDNSIFKRKNIMDQCKTNIKDIKRSEKIELNKKSSKLKNYLSFKDLLKSNEKNKEEINKNEKRKKIKNKTIDENGFNIDDNIEKVLEENTERSFRLTFPSSKKLLINLSGDDKNLKEKENENSNNQEKENLRKDEKDIKKDEKNKDNHKEVIDKNLKKNYEDEKPLKFDEKLVKNNNNIINNCINNKKINTKDILLKKGKNFIKNHKSHYSYSKAGTDELGRSKTNQDIYLVLTNINGVKEFNIFGVLDGHGREGHLVSNFVSRYIQEKFHTHPKLEKIKDINKIYEILSSRNFDLVKKLFINADDALRNEDIDSKNSGTTCTLIIQIGENIISANVGDSRAILVFDMENDKDLNHLNVFPLSFDSKPETPDERERILKMGGVVKQLTNKYGQAVGPYRVWVKNKDYPGLAMSRSIGDFCAKMIGVISDPEIIECKINSHCKFVVICSDGVWEFLNNEDVMNLGKKYYLKNNPRGFCKKLIEKSVKFWKKEDIVIDDITVVIIFF